MNKQPPDDRKFLIEDLEQAPTHCSEGSDEIGVSEDPNRDLRLRFTRLLRRGPSAWRHIGAFLDFREQGYTDDIFKIDPMSIALMISEATDQNGVGLPLMTLVNSNIKFDGGYIVGPSDYFFDSLDKSDKDLHQALTVDPVELKSARDELRTKLKNEEKAKRKRLSTIATDQPCDDIAEKELEDLVEKKIKAATSSTRRRLKPLLSANLIEVISLSKFENIIAYQSTPLLREALYSMMTGKWAFETEENKS